MSRLNISLIILFILYLEAHCQLPNEALGLENICQLYKYSKWNNWGDCKNSSVACQYWQGVKCFNNSVVALDFSFMNLYGILPPVIGLNFHNLTILNISNNILLGTLPQELANMNNLQILNLTHNSLIGELDVIQNLTSLQILDISNNFFGGTIPSFTDFQELKILRLNSNTLKGGFPQDLATLTTIEIIDISDNLLTGPLYPDSLSLTDLPNKILRCADYQNVSEPWGLLQSLVISGNTFSGTIPLYYGVLPNLQNLDIGEIVDLKGTLPVSFKCLTKLKEISIKTPTSLCGILPSEWSQQNFASCDLTGYRMSCDQANLLQYPCKNQCVQGEFTGCAISIGSVSALATGLAISFSLLVIIGVLVTIRIFRMKTQRLRVDLDCPELDNFFDIATAERRGFEKIVNTEESIFYQKELKSNDTEYKVFLRLKKILDFRNIEASTVYAVISPLQVSLFSNHKKLVASRIKNSPDQFCSRGWVNDDPHGNREWTHNLFRELLDSSPFHNEDILPAVHGTSVGIAWKIVETGFAALSNLDSGFYGKGIYLSTSASYIIPYFGTKAQPAILICLTLPGNTYPTTESRTDPKNLLGAAIKKGYQSHYVRTLSSGNPATPKDIRTYDEIVLETNPQVLPMFLIKVNKENLGELLTEFQREVMETNKNEKTENSNSNEGSEKEYSLLVSIQ